MAVTVTVYQVFVYTQISAALNFGHRRFFLWWEKANANVSAHSAETCLSTSHLNPLTPKFREHCKKRGGEEEEIGVGGYEVVSSQQGVDCPAEKGRAGRNRSWKVWNSVFSTGHGEQEESGVGGCEILSSERSMDCTAEKGGQEELAVGGCEVLSSEQGMDWTQELTSTGTAYDHQASRIPAWLSGLIKPLP